MANVHDVASYILEKSDGVSTWKLQKLVYYSQAWHLAWEDHELFSAPIEAWANGPVVRELYLAHRGKFTVTEHEAGNSAALTRDEAESVEAVLATYGQLSGRQLCVMTHNESPWLDARGDLGVGDRSTVVIPTASMQAYYSALDVSDDASPVSEVDWDLV